MARSSMYDQPAAVEAKAFIHAGHAAAKRHGVGASAVVGRAQLESRAGAAEGEPEMLGAGVLRRIRHQHSGM